MPEQSFEDHGGLNLGELNKLNLSHKNIVDFSVNSNPFGPGPNVLKVIKEVDISTYPQRESFELSEKLAELNGVRKNQILIGNGTAELIWLAVLALIKPGDQVLIIGPTFGEYHKAAAQMKAVVKEIRANEEDFQAPVQAAVNFIRRQKPRLVFLCNPNNPSGKLLNQEELAPLIEVCGEQSLLILDEAYYSFIDGHFFGRVPAGSCLVLRSMTKDFSLAGLRLGYALAAPELLQRLKAFQPAWSVNSFAQAAGLAVISDLDYYRHTLQKLKPLSKKFFHDLSSSGYDLIPSDVHFCLLHVKQTAGPLRLQLLRAGFQVRDCSSFGLPEFIRISTRLEGDNKKFLKTLQEIIPVK